MKSPEDASRKMEGEHCTAAMEIPEANLQVCTLCFWTLTGYYTLAVLISMKQSGVYDVLSCTDTSKHYTVTVTSSMCGDKPACIPQCTSVKCQYLCRHMVSCTCWDYIEGHLCKHCHKVWSNYCRAAENLEPPQDPGLVCDDFGYNPEVEKETNAGEYTAAIIVHVCEFCSL